MSKSLEELAQWDGSNWQIPEVGAFQHELKWTFNEASLPEGLRKSTDLIPKDQDGDARFDHKYEESNVYLDDSFLNLVVPGGQTQGPIRCAEVSSTVSDILYGSVEIRAIFSQHPGTCASLFFYESDTQEADIEYLSDPTSLSNEGKPIPLMHYTNQSHIPKGPSTHSTGPAPEDVTASHLYRIDWLPDRTTYSIDGVVQSTLDTNVPNVGCKLILNNWANGDPEWSVGPPAQDNHYKILNIFMYFNRAGN